jgi:hypothetical protein
VIGGAYPHSAKCLTSLSLAMVPAWGRPDVHAFADFG